MYLVVASNANHVYMLGPALRVLERRGHDVRVLSADAWYSQGSGTAARALGLPWEEIPGPPGRGKDDWFTTPWDRRLVSTEAAAPRIRCFLEDLAPEAVALGNDTGLLEQLMISAARDLGVPTFVMQDADFVRSQADHRPCGQLLLGEGGCDAILAWGPRGAEYYRALGLSVPLFEVGSPKIGAFKTGPRARRTLLVPLQCCARYSTLTEDQERDHFMTIIDAVRQPTDVEVLVTPHPSHGHAERAWYAQQCAERNRVRWVEDTSSTDLLPDVAAVISIDSAFLLDALSLGIPAVAATFGVAWAKTEYEGAVPVFEDAATLFARTADASWIDSLHVDRAFCDRLLTARGDASAELIADALCSTRVPDDVPEVTVVFDDPADIDEINRQRDVRVNLVQGPAADTADLGFVAFWPKGAKALPHRLSRACAALAADPETDAVTSDLLCGLPCGPALSRVRIDDSGNLPAGWRSTLVIRGAVLSEMDDTAFWPNDRELLERLRDQERWAHIPEPLAMLDDEHIRAIRPRQRWEDAEMASGSGPAPDGEQVDLSVIICTFNRAPIALECLESFCQQTADRSSYEIILVDDSTDPTLHDTIEGFTWPVRTRVIRRERGSLASARNAAIEVAEGRYLLIVNDDTIAFPELVAEHLRAHRMAPDEISVLGTFEQPPEALDGALMRVLEGSTEVFCYAAMQPGQRYDWTRYWTCNVSSPADAVRRAGCFDEGFENYGCEDTDLGWRLDRLGLPVLYHGAARAWHRHILSFDDLAKRQVTVARAWVRLLSKHPEMIEHPDWTWVQSVSRKGANATVAAHATLRPAWERAARTLSASDVGGLASIGDDGAAVARGELKLLGELVRLLNQVWWQEGFALGMADHDLESLGELAARLPDPLADMPAPRVVILPDAACMTPSALTSGLRAAIAKAATGTLVVCADPDGASSLLPHVAAASLAFGEPPDVVRMNVPDGAPTLRRLMRSADTWVSCAEPSARDHDRAARAAGTGIVHPEPGHELAALAPVRLLARPDWRDPSSIRDLLKTFGPVVAGREDVCLAFYVDPRNDPALEEIISAIGDAHAATLGADTDLNALAVDDAGTRERRAALVRSVHAVLAPAHGFDLADATVCTNREELRGLLDTFDARCGRASPKLPACASSPPS